MGAVKAWAMDLAEKQGQDPTDNYPDYGSEGFVCKVCGEAFTDGWDHALTKEVSPNGKGGIFWGFKDETHYSYAHKLSGNNYKDAICFCGGKVRTFVSGEDSYSVECDDCGFLFDED